MIKTRTYNSFSDSLLQARDYLSKDLEEVNKLILSKLSDKVPLVNGMAGYLIQAGGKRLRPILLLLIARLFSYKGMRHIKLAAAIEFIHTATLLHDDVVDRSTQRRGRPSANAIWGDSSCILVGDFLLSRAFEFVTDDGSLEIMEVLSRMTTSVAEGEIMQLGAIGNLELEEKTLLSDC
ncbi:MAG: polyprenyl synthetase family protein [Holosporaceae bacterium]|nr:MAG: polyprenyl synthetase family protein [Holosporaceae bacterium]